MLNSAAVRMAHCRHCSVISAVIFYSEYDYVHMLHVRTLWHHVYTPLSTCNQTLTSVEEGAAERWLTNNRGVGAATQPALLGDGGEPAVVVYFI